MDRQQLLSFCLTTVFLEDEKTGDITAFYAQFPDASAQGRDKDEAKKLLDEIFPHMLREKGEEFKRYHIAHNKSVSYLEQKVHG